MVKVIQAIISVDVYFHSVNAGAERAVESCGVGLVASLLREHHSIIAIR